MQYRFLCSASYVHSYFSKISQPKFEKMQQMAQGMPTLLFGCLCLFDFQGLIQLFENLRLLKRVAISFTHQHRMSIEPFITYWEIQHAYNYFSKKSLIPMIIQVPTIINISKISHAYCNSGAYLYQEVKSTYSRLPNKRVT